MNANSTVLQSVSGMPVDGTDSREAYPKRWIAALVKIRSEKAVSAKLTQLNIESYVPTQSELHQWSDRKKKVERVVIPMVIFIHTDEMTERRLRTYTYIYKILSYPGQYNAAIIPDEQIDQLKYMLRHADSPVEMIDQNLQVGQQVRIARGPLKGLEGELCYVEAEKPMVAIRIECLGYACVSVSKGDLEAI